MKKIAVLAMLIILISACKKKGCTDALAENYSTEAKKDDGTCTYAQTKFIGTFNTNQTCYYGGDTTFSMSVTEGPSKAEIVINNFGNFDVSVKATVAGGNISFKEDIAGITYEGTGYIVGNTLTINYEVCETYYYPCSDPEICSLTGTK